jgi:hypothetical protein
MNGKKSAAIVDFDDTLFFVRRCIETASIEVIGHRLSRAQVRKLMPKELRGRVYDVAFSKYSDLSVPNRELIGMLSKWKDSGISILILTARPEKTKRETMMLLRKYRVPFHRIIFRDNELAYGRDEEWKLGKLKGIADKYDSVTIYEDKHDNIAYFRHGVANPEKFRFVEVKEKRGIQLGHFA